MSVGEAHITFEDVEKNFYFTFGQGHVQLDGTPMKDYWVRVQAESFMEARMLFIENFSSIKMERPDKWAFQYTDQDFDKTWFPKGEYTLITKSNDKNQEKTQEHFD